MLNKRLSKNHILAIAVASVLLLFIYHRLLYKYGTLAPPAVWYFTRGYDGRDKYDYPPENWKPPFKVIVTLTTTPSRLTKVNDALQSLSRQTLRPSAIYLNVPEGKMKRFPERSYDELKIPEAILKNTLVKVNRCKDYGPATKLIATLYEEHDEETLIITLDDDFVYPPRLVEALAWESYNRPEDIHGVCGWGTVPYPGGIGMIPVYVPYMLRPYGREVDILQACCGIGYRRGFFHDLKQLETIPDVCVTVDDVWFSGYSAILEKRKRIIISKPLDPAEPSWKAEESRSSAAKMKLSDFNDANLIHYKCVQAIENLFGTPWTRVYERL